MIRKWPRTLRDRLGMRKLLLVGMNQVNTEDKCYWWCESRGGVYEEMCNGNLIFHKVKSLEEFLSDMESVKKKRGS